MALARSGPTPYATRDAVIPPSGTDEAEACVKNHSVQIFDRGGRRRRWQIVDLSRVEWARTKDAKSQSVFKVEGRSCRDQASILSKIEPRRHELRVYRGDEQVWEGPIVDGSWKSDSAEFIANDGKEYLDFTALSKDWPGPDAGGPALMTDRIEQIVNHELTVPYIARVGTGGAATDRTFRRWEQISPPANILPFIDIRHSDTLLTRSDTVQFEMTLGEHLDNLARGGLDYVVVGRSLIIWDSAYAIGQTRVVTEADFYGDIQVLAAGADHWDISHISAERSEEEDDAGVQSGVGSAGAEHDYYGVWTNIVSLSSEEGGSEPTQDALNSQAQRDLVGRTPVPIALRVADGAGIRLSHGLSINMLVPGVIMPVRAEFNLRKVQQDQILEKMKVVETPQGENITVSLVPSGAVGLVS